MKVVLLLACISAILSFNLAKSGVIQAPLDLITLDDLSESDRKQLEYLEEHYDRPKRSGSGDILGTIKSAIGYQIKSKLGLLAKSSASASGHFSSSSSGGHGHSTGHSYHHYDHDHPPETYDHKQFDFWSLKKSILNTLLQAVKAIKGGVIAIKGQLIKGSGHLTTATGKLISSKGEAITNLGKNIASSALLSPHHGHGYSAPGHGEIVYAPSSHGHYEHAEHPSGAEVYHGSPSAPGPEYDTPEQYHHHPSGHEDAKPHDGPAGILILKKMPGHDTSHISSDAEDTKVPDFKPIEPSGPSYGSIFSKFFSASTSLDPHEPKPFGAPTGYASHKEPVYHDSPPSSSGHEDSSHYHHAPPPEPTVVSNYKDSPPTSDHQYSPPTAPSSHDYLAPSVAPTGLSNFQYSPPTDQSLSSEPQYFNNQYNSDLPNIKDQPLQYIPTAFSAEYNSGKNSMKPLENSYGYPFEESPNYLNLDGLQSGSKKNPQRVRPNSIKVQNAPPKRAKEPHKPIYQAKRPSHETYSSPVYKSKKPSSHSSNSGKANFYKSDSFKNMPFSGVPPIHQVPNHSHSLQHQLPKHPQAQETQHPAQNYDVVKSISYELGPNGPKRLT